MVRGVSKTVIVVNDTGSRLFEKIVFYVTPEYGNLSAKQLKKAASDFSFHYGEHFTRDTLRKRVKRKKRIRMALAAGFLLLVAAIVLWIFL